MGIRPPQSGLNRTDMSPALEQVLGYHQATKHHFHAYARGPGYLDWDTQPDPFRRYRGAPLTELEQVPPTQQPEYGPALIRGNLPAAPLNYHSLSQFFFDSLAISAWKQAGNVSWALRVNPSSGNLHPTEGYLICGPLDGICDTPRVGHYAPREHALEWRARFPPHIWRALTAQLPQHTFLVGLSSIHWREAWKYGERAFRYCQHDVGHAIAALSIAAAALGWGATLLDDVGTQQVAVLLGISDPQGAEPEHADCLLAVHPQDQVCRVRELPHEAVAAFAGLAWQGRPNQLSPDHVDWSIDVVAGATIKPASKGTYDSEIQPDDEALPAWHLGPMSLRQIIRQRRSAVDMDGRTGITRDTFYAILSQTLPGPTRVPFNALPWSPRVHLALFVHRVQDLEPGLYMLIRATEQKAALQSALSDEFDWEKPQSCPSELPVYRLRPGDARAAARQVSCEQAIASDGCFSLGMLADFERSLHQFGAWFYTRLYWECGVIGQAMYLAAEAAHRRGTGIGCFFDDAVHYLLGLDLHSFQYQSLYHFTVGKHIEDVRLTTLPAYPPGKM
jgi:SagB-type dehydrogenase family enzyme